MKTFSKLKGGILFGVGLTVIALDQWTKHMVYTQFHFGETVPIIREFFALTYVRNAGAAFGLLHNAPSYFRDPFFIIVPLVALFIIFVVLAKLREDQKLTAGALSLILGGAVGNLIDRLRFGYVVDFLDFHWKEVYHWPAFNVADSCIVVGVSFLFIQSFFQNKICLDDIQPKNS
jgi:signal peptidase II